MRTIITFLNDKGLREGMAYRWQGHEYEGGVFSLALRQFVTHDRMLVCNTPEAERVTWPYLLALHDPRIEPVPIPRGETTAEMWEMFDAITSRVGEGESVVFDITHGLRSLPFLVFLFAAYLKSAKNVHIDAIYYGALELGKPAPVIDLSEFVGILDWLNATNQFIHTGDARYLAELLKEAGEERRVGALSGAGSKLDQFSLAMMLCRPLEVMEEAAGLGKELSGMSGKLTLDTQPFALLADRIQETYAGRALADPTGNVVPALAQQIDLVGWYLEHNQVIQGVTLAREWVVTAVSWRLGHGFTLRRDERQAVEWAITGVARSGQARAGQEESVGEMPADGQAILTWETCSQLRDLWDRLAGVRNDLDHAGMSQNRMKASTLARKAKDDIWPRLRDLAIAWGVINAEAGRP